MGRFKTAAEFAAKTVEINMGFVGHIVEATGHNDGPQIDKIEAVWGLKGEPYCAMGLYWPFAKVYCWDNDIPFTEANCVQVFHDIRHAIAKNWLEFSPLVAAMVAANKKVDKWREFERHTDSERLRHGDVIMFKFRQSSGKVQNHVGQFDRLWPGGKIGTIEWNTTSAGAATLPGLPESNDPKQGGGCYYKMRDPDPDVVWGWVPWTYGRP